MNARDKHRLGNHSVTLDTLLAANFANMSSEDFAQAMKHAATVNRLIISRAKCNNQAHYEQVVATATTMLQIILMERRNTDKPALPHAGKSIDLDAEFGDSWAAVRGMK